MDSDSEIFDSIPGWEYVNKTVLQIPQKLEKKARGVKDDARYASLVVQGW